MRAPTGDQGAAAVAEAQAEIAQLRGELARQREEMERKAGSHEATLASARKDLVASRMEGDEQRAKKAKASDEVLRIRGAMAKQSSECKAVEVRDPHNPKCASCAAPVLSHGIVPGCSAR